MTKAYVIVKDGGTELAELYREHERRTIHASSVLIEKGMKSIEFQTADAATGETRHRIREIIGCATNHWSA